MKAALLQLASGDDPTANLPVTRSLVAEAAAQGAGFVLTPEVTNCRSLDRAHQRAVLRHEHEDETLAALSADAAAHRIWLLIGSLALKTEDEDGRFANRSFLIGPDGKVRARYDKINMFDVDVSDSETYRESSGYRPGNRAVIASTPFGMLGLTICYDLRFPQLFRRLAQAGAHILTVPANFTATTGRAHWEVLLRARAIENGAYVLAPAQTGSPDPQAARPHESWGHALAVAPWGEVIAEAGADVGVTYAEIDLAAVDRARRRIPSLMHDHAFEGP